MSDLQEQNNMLMSRLSQCESENERVSGQNQNLARQLSDLEAKNNMLNSKLSQCESEKESLRSENVTLTGERQELRERIRCQELDVEDFGKRLLDGGSNPHQ